MAAGTFGTIGKDGHVAWCGRLPRRWKKLQKVESKTEHVVGDGTSAQKRIGLAGLEGEQRGRGMELVVDGPSV